MYSNLKHRIHDFSITFPKFKGLRFPDFVVVFHVDGYSLPSPLCLLMLDTLDTSHPPPKCYYLKEIGINKPFQYQDNARKYINFHHIVRARVLEALLEKQILVQRVGG